MKTLTWFPQGAWTWPRIVALVVLSPIWTMALLFIALADVVLIFMIFLPDLVGHYLWEGKSFKNSLREAWAAFRWLL